MSDLNQLIASWRNGMADLSNPQRDELEDHLQEQIVALQRGGLSLKEAFTIAAMRCGYPTALATEFAQADPATAWSHRLRWMVVGFVLCTCVSGLIMGANTALGLVLVKQELSLSTVITIRMCFLTVFVAVTAVLWRRWWQKKRPAPGSWPRSWMISNWTLSIAIAVIPGLYTLAHYASVRTLVARRLFTPQEWGELAMANAVVGLALPFAAPLMLLLIALHLSRRPNPAH